MTDQTYMQAMEKVLEQGTSDIDVYLGLSQLYLQSHQAHKAKKLLLRALTFGVDHPGLHDFLAIANIELKLRILAEVEVKKALDLDKNNAFLFRRLGFIYIMERRYKDAYDAFSQSFQIQQDTEIQEKIAELAQRIEEIKVSVLFCQHALDLSDLLPETWSNLAQSLIEIGKYDDAIEAFRQAFKLSQDVTHILNLGYIFAIQGRYDYATECFRKVISEDNANAEAWRYLGQIEEILSNYESATASYERATQLEEAW